MLALMRETSIVKILLMALLITLLYEAEAHASVKVEIYGDEDYPPYSYMNNGHLVGIYADLIHKAAEKLLPEYEVILKPVPWRRGIDGLKNGYIFALFPPYFSSDRTSFVESLSRPLYRESVIIVCRESVMHEPRMVFPDDFSELVIGRNTDFLLSGEFVSAARDGKFRLNETRGNNKNLQKLVNGRIDCYANDRLSIWYTYSAMKKTDPSIERTKIVEAMELTQQDAYIAYSKNYHAEYRDDFIKKMNDALDSLNKDNTVLELINKYQP